MIVRLDLKNAYNEIKRALALMRLNEVDQLLCLVPLFWAAHHASSGIYLASSGLERAKCASDGGVLQGNGLAGAAFCAGIHPEVQVLGAELSACGGVARFIMDDGDAVGPPDVVFDTVRRFRQAVPELGLNLQ